MSGLTSSAIHPSLLPYNLYAGQYTVMKISKASGKKMLGFHSKLFKDLTICLCQN